ncbi:CoA transferase [Alcaligenaceae bacterium]|nr:CoA transferase [Alcaligenaceae bacterium]
MSLPLKQIRVLDLSRILAAPWAAQIMGDLGAEVIKVERPNAGDDARRFGPPFLKDSNGDDTQESAFYISANRNKKSITVDISKPEGQELVRKLVAVSDVFIENYKVNDLKRYGLDYETLHDLNPKLIYCSVTGFGQSGPYSHRPGYDFVFQAMGGLMSVTGAADDQPGAGPMKVGPSLADIQAGHFTLSAILAALYHRDVNGGQGQHIDIALLDSIVASISHYSSHYLIGREVPIRRGNEGNGGMPQRTFMCADQVIVIVIGNDDQFVRFCRLIGMPELANDPRFEKNLGRGLNRKALAEILDPIIATWKSDELLTRLEQNGVPCGPVNDLRQVFDDQQIKWRAMEVRVPHPLSQSGEVSMVANPVKFSETPITEYLAPPMLGQHSEEVLSDVLGLTREEISELRVGGII